MALDQCYIYTVASNEWKASGRMLHPRNRMGFASGLNFGFIMSGGATGDRRVIIPGRYKVRSS